MKKSLLFLLTAALLGAEAKTVLLEDDFRTKKDVWQKVWGYAPFSSIELIPGKGYLMRRNPKRPQKKGEFYDTAFALCSKRLTLPKDAVSFEVLVEAMTNREQLTCHGHDDGCHNRIVWYDKNGKRMTEKESFYSPVFRKNRFIITQTKDRIPAGAVTAELQFGVDVPNFLQGEELTLKRIRFTVGTAPEIAEIPILQKDVDHSLLLQSPSPTKDGTKPAVFSVTNPDSVDWTKSRVRLDGKDVTSQVKISGGRMTLYPSGSFAPGLHFVEAELRDKDGITDDAVSAFAIGEKRKINVMTLRDDGMAMMNGKPFFCLGIACLVKQGRNGFNYENAFREVSEAGMNFARHWSTFTCMNGDAAEYLRCAKKYNIYLAFSPSNVQNDGNLKRVAEFLWKQMNIADPVIVWDIGDDTSGYISPERFGAKARLVRSIDPTRLTSQADGVGRVKDGYRAYSPYGENFQPEIYPIGCNGGKKETPEMTAKMVPRVIFDMKRINADHRDNKVVKSVWPLIQYFHYKPGSRNWDRMPTEAEIRAMSYLAIIHGAHGVYWYRYAGYPQTPNATRGYSDEQWNILKKLSLELRGMYDVLCARTGKQTQKVKLLSGPAKDGMEFDSVNTLLKEWNGTKYLFVCNSAMKPVKASFTVSGAKSAKDRFGKKALSVKNGSFEDTLEGYGVRVYEIR